MPSLFPSQPVEYPIDDGQLLVWPDFLDPSSADLFMQQLSDEIAWRQDQIKLFGKTHLIPRLQAFQSEPGIQYRYSGLSLNGDNWHPALNELRNQMYDLCGHHFNACLLNLYRDGKDSMGWHADDEPELGLNPVIASISLGQTRRFLLRRKDDHAQKHELKLTHGSLLIMAGSLQHHWQHSIPRSAPVQDARINLTFRQIG